jgi:hypothetical protein
MAPIVEPSLASCGEPGSMLVGARLQVRSWTNNDS